jgi:hypothetical protein
MGLKRKPKDEDEFVQGAEDQGQDQDQQILEAFPWDEYRNGPKSFNIRLSEEDYAMLKLVFEHSRDKSLQKMIRKIIRAYLVGNINDMREKGEI